MTIIGLGLVLAAALCHAIWNFFVKRVNGGPELVWLFSLISVTLYLPVAIFFVIAGQARFGLIEAAFIGLSTVLHLGYFLLLQQGYRRGDLSLVYPTARATGPLLSITFAVAFLGERMTYQIAVGGIAVIVGILFLTGGFRQGGKRVVASTAFGMAAGVFIGSYTIADAYSVSVLLVPPLLLDYASSLGRAVLLTPIAAGRKHLVAGYWRDHTFSIIAIAVFNPLAYILVLYALTFTPVVYVAPAREISVLITVMMGSVWLGEGDLRRRMLWAVVVVSGVALLATA
jgi:drug/metabolite transporter (DMT)-like permease